MIAENPRWTQCRIALGREPRAVDFMLWIQERWRDFEDAGLQRPTGMQEAFDLWLVEGVAVGRWRA